MIKYEDHPITPHDIVSDASGLELTLDWLTKGGARISVYGEGDSPYQYQVPGAAVEIAPDEDGNPKIEFPVGTVGAMTDAMGSVALENFIVSPEPTPSPRAFGLKIDKFPKPQATGDIVYATISPDSMSFRIGPSPL